MAATRAALRRAVEKRADVTYLAQLGAGKGNRRHGLLHGVYLINSMHLSKPNVYHTLVSVWRHSRPSEETSIDTLGQLVSPPFSGVIVIVRSQEGRLSGFKNREEWKNSPRVRLTRT